MTARWVAGSVRAQGLAHRQLGMAAAAELASVPPGAAVDLLAASSYGPRVRPGDTPAVAARAVADTLLWNLRVLAGWAPPAGAQLLRLLVGWFEIANVEEHLRGLDGRDTDPPFALGALATAWPRLRRAGSREELRTQLATSPWGDPGGSTDHDIAVGMRLAWAARVADRLTPARPWACAAGALLLARERFALPRPLPGGGQRSAGRLVGGPALAAGSLEDFIAGLPGSARWVFTGVTTVADLWQAEPAWWRRVRQDAAAMSAGARLGPDRLVGAAALLAADAMAVRAALAASARGDGRAVFDALA